MGAGGVAPALVVLTTEPRRCRAWVLAVLPQHWWYCHRKARMSGMRAGGIAPALVVLLVVLPPNRANVEHLCHR